MFFILYFATGTTFNEIKKYLAESIQGATLTSNTDDELVLTHDSFTLRLTHNGNSIQFASEDYELALEFCLWIDVISSSKSWADDLIELSNKILNEYEGNLILESNGEKPMLIRNSTGLFVDKKLRSEDKFPLNLLTMNYEDKDLVRA